MDSKKIIKLILQAVLLIAVIGIAFYFADLARGNGNIQRVVASYGYIGIFIVSLISGFNFVVPIPAISFLPLFLESGLHFSTTIVIISLGMTTADAIAYLLGNLGKKMVPGGFGKKFEEFVSQMHKKYMWAPLLILFLFASVAPLPNEVLLVPFAFLNYRLIHILPVVFVGNIVFNLLYSQGIISIFNIF
jgi:membrane protein YqaA with SNARE-associated domain